MTAAGRRGAWVWLGLTLVLAGAVIWIYARTAGYGFVMFDDDINLYLNPRLGAPDAHALVWMLTDGSRMLRYLPLGWLGFSAVFTVGGLDPTAYHVANLGIHALNAVLAFAVFARLMPVRSVGRPEEGGIWRAWSAAAGAAFWALHPLRVETVAWASGQLYLHATAWALVSTLAYQTVLVRRQEGKPVGRWLMASCAAYAASLLAYPLAFGLPVVFAALALTQVQVDSPRTPARRRFLLAVAAPHAVLAVGALVSALAIRLGQSGLWNPAASASGFGPGARLSQAAYLIVRYLRLTLVPGRLTPADDLLERFSPASALFLGSAVLVFALTTALWLARRRFSGLGWLAMAYLALLVPFLGLLEHPYYPCDRYTYLPGLVLGAAVALGLSRLQAPRWRIAAIVTSLVLCAAYAVVSRRQTAIWRDTDTLFGRIVQKARGERLRTLFLGRLAWNEALLGRTVEAKQRLDGLMRNHAGDPGLTSIERRIAGLEPSHPSAYRGSSPLAREVHRMALVDAKEGRFFDAEQRLRYALALSPRFAEGRYNLAIVLVQRGETLEAMDDYLVATAPGSGLCLTEGQRARTLGVFEQAFRQAGEARWASACMRAASAP